MGSDTECCRHLPGGTDPYLSHCKGLTLGVATSTQRHPGAGACCCSRRRRVNPNTGSARWILHRMQRLVQERDMYVPIGQQAFISGAGLCVGQSGFGLIPGLVYTAARGADAD